MLVLLVYGSDRELRARVPGTVAVDGARNRAGELLGGDATARREAALARAVELAVRQGDRAAGEAGRAADAGRGGLRLLGLAGQLDLEPSP